MILESFYDNLFFPESLPCGRAKKKKWMKAKSDKKKDNIFILFIS
jgi:hypothetical protein